MKRGLPDIEHLPHTQWLSQVPACLVAVREHGGAEAPGTSFLARM